MKNNLLLLLGVVLFAAACSDPEKDPFQLEKIKKGSLISLRGQGLINLGEPVFLGAVDSFSISGNNNDNNFEFAADYISEDVNNMAEVQIFARATENGPRQRVATVAGSAFSSVADSKYPRASISVPLADILNAIGKTAGDFSKGNYIYVECDLTLTDGSSIPASSIVNSSLFETGYFYPAHNLLYIAGQ